MNPDEMKLPELENAAFTSNVLLRKEWVMDPPYLIMQRLPDDILIDIYRLKVEGFAELAEIESQKLAVEAKVFRGIAKRLG